jgi:hypothetical protein
MAGHILHSRWRAGDRNRRIRHNRMNRLRQAGYSRRCFVQRLATKLLPHRRLT